MRKTVLLTVFLAFLALVAPSASQAKPLPNHAAIDQYTEGVPTAKGQKSEQGAGALPPGTAQSLDSLGKDGAAAAAVAKVTAPSPGGGGGSQTSGMGIWLWLILAACLLAALTRYFARWRAGRPAG
ncbi:MAG: hypothetical protein QOD60_733 [Solirubrobacterales bacterium]|jgi:hypothetical protein|nr:hypothetical protein [Solirubrobacterales bacterium]